MKILLVNVDSKFNIAIRKLYRHYLNSDHEVEMINLGMTAFPGVNFKYISALGYDKVYCSNLFEINQDRFEVVGCENVIYGGIGSINPNLRLDPEVQKLQPYYYESDDTTHMRLTEGCIRKCWFCKVPTAEGTLKQIDTLDSVRHNKVMFYDNNIFAWDQCVDTFKEIVKLNLKVDFNQGLDFRLATEEKMEWLVKMRYTGSYIFAFDDVKYQKAIEAKLPLLRKYIPKEWKMRFYVYHNEEFMTIKDLIHRAEWCKANKILPYIMRDQNCWGSKHDHFIKDYAAYCNQPSMFKKIGFIEFLSKRHTDPNRIKESIEVYKANE